jgi:hypothetical protein
MNIFNLFKKKDKTNKKYENKSDMLENIKNDLIKVKSFTIPDIKDIDKYTKAFKILLDTGDLNKLFEVVKFIEQKSSNGLIYVVKLIGSESKFSNLLIKIQKDELGDPASYEYYIGLCLNKLRGMGVPNFGLVYGRFNCGFNPGGMELCNKLHKKKTYVLYEYITSLSGKTISLGDFIDLENIDKIKKNVNLVNILIMLLISLQKAQDIMSFTHYDLHLGNILLVELNKTYEFIYEYKKKKYKIMLDYYPFIIDYGRSYVNPKEVDKIDTIYDSDNDTYYYYFEDYQKKIWKNKKFVKDNDRSVVRHIKRKLSDESFVTNLKKVMEKEFKIKDKDITVDMVLDNIYKDDNGAISYGIIPWKFNPYFDHCKLLNHVCDGILESGDDNKLWVNLRIELDKVFPFYIPGYYGVFKYYDFVKTGLKRPIDVVKYLYIDTVDNKTTEVYDKLYFTQIGGKESKMMYKKLYKEMKKKW